MFIIQFLLPLILSISNPISITKSSNLFPDFNARVGVAVDKYYTGDSIDDFDWSSFDINLWTYNYSATSKPSIKTNQYQQVWSTELTDTKLENIKRIAVIKPGSKWLIGNEPDGSGQSNRTPEQYADEYFIIYHAIKEEDSSALIYFGGISQPSGMRIRYLEQMIEYYERTYQESFPFDGIHVHNYILPEKGGSGLGQAVGITNNLDAYGQEYWGLHSNLDIFKSQIVSFRTWMKLRGYENKPLIVSEYGILLPVEWGYTPFVVGEFLKETMFYMLYAQDCFVGNPLDEYRLVQEFAWFSANYTPHSNSMLFDSNKNLTDVGVALKEFIDNVRQ